MIDNKAYVMGRLTRDPDIRQTQDGVNVASFSVAIDRVSKGKEKETDFIEIVAWRSTADFISKYFSKGKKIGIWGSLRTDKWTDKDGNKRSRLYVLADEVGFVESKGSSPATTTEEDSAPNETVIPEEDDDLPF